MAKTTTKCALNPIVGANVKAARLRLCLSQDAFAELLLVHRTYVGSIERGEANLTLATLERIAVALDVTPQHLITDWSGGKDA